MPELDLVLRDAVIFDGTGGEPFRGDVGVKGDRIAAVSADLVGTDVIECAGLAVAPGFIDTHSHSDLVVIDAPSLPMKVRQGVTLELLGQDGIGAAPLRTQDTARRRCQTAALLTDPKIEWNWQSEAEYLAAVEAARPVLDVGTLVPHGAVRECVMGMEARPADDAELARMKGLLARCLDEGAWGMSTGLGFPPCCWADTREVVALAGVCAGRGVPVVAKVRSESARAVEAVEELFRVGRESAAQVHLSHLGISGRGNWGKLPAILAAVENARAADVRVTADQYPYVASSTWLGAILPPWAHAGGPGEAAKRLRAPTERARLRAEILDAGETDWDNPWKWEGPAGIVVADVASGRRRDAIGKSLEDAAAAAHQAPLEFALDMLADEAMGVSVVAFGQSEKNVEKILTLPFVNACTGGLLGCRPHPRAYGAFPRVLGHYVRERRTLSLEVAVRKLTGLAADTFGLSEHGYVLAGKRGDLVAFDPDRVADRATFEEPAQFPAGIVHVVVGGKIVVRDGEPTAERPGRVLRRVTRR